MKKLYIFVILMLGLIMLNSCQNEKKVSVLLPTGTPSLALAGAFDDEMIEKEIVSGSDPLVAGFTNAKHDIIVAPVNLGIKFYNTQENFDYRLYETIVWGNYYIASLKEMNSINDLNDKTLVVFGKNSTPDVMIRLIINKLNLNVTLEYVDDVATANSYLVSKKADYIISAEPSVSKLKQKLAINLLSLQEEYKKVVNNDLPQAAIFVKKDSYSDKQVKNVLNKMVESVNNAISKKEELVEKAVINDENLNNVGKDNLLKALPNCNIYINTKQKEAITMYVQKVIELGLKNSVGGKVPDEEFYIKENNL